MEHFNYYYEDFQDEKLNLTDRIILSTISSFNEYEPDYKELKKIIGIDNEKYIKLSIKKLKDLNLVQGEETLQLTNKTQGRYFRVDIEAGLNIKQLLVKSYIISLPDKAFYGSVETLSNVLSISPKTTSNLLVQMTKQSILHRDKYGKRFKYSLSETVIEGLQIEETTEIPTVEEQIIEETPIEEEMNNNNSVDIEALEAEIEALKTENEALKTRIENAIVEYRKLKEEYYKVEYQRQLLEAENQKLKLNQNKQTKTTNNISKAPLPLTPSVLDKIKWYAKYFFCKCIDSNKWGFLGGDMQDFYNYLNKLTPITENDDIQVDLEPYKDSSDMLKYCFMNLKYLLNNILLDENNSIYHSGIENYYKGIYERNKK